MKYLFWIVVFACGIGCAEHTKKPAVKVERHRFRSCFNEDAHGPFLKMWLDPKIKLSPEILHVEVYFVEDLSFGTGTKPEYVLPAPTEKDHDSLLFTETGLPNVECDLTTGMCHVSLEDL